MKNFSFILALFFLASPAYAAISYPSTGFFSITDGSGSSGNAILSATLDASVDKLLVSVIGRETITGCTYDGDSMTLIEASAIQYGYNYHSTYYLDNPSTGSAHDLVCSYSSSTAWRGMTYVGASGTDTGIDASVASVAGTTDGSMISTNITNTLDNSDILQSVYTNNNTLTLLYGTDQTQLVGIPDDEVWSSFDFRPVATAGSYTVTVEPASGTPNQDVLVFSIPVSAYSPPATTSTSSALYTGPTYYEWLTVMAIFMFIASFSLWRELFGWIYNKEKK